MAVPRFLLPQGQGCDTQPATIELIPAWCLEILPQQWISSWNVGFKGLWTAADKLKLGGFFSFLYEHKELFFLAVVFSVQEHTANWNTQPLSQRGRRQTQRGSENAVCMQPFLRESCVFTSLCHSLFISKTNYFLLLLLFPRREVFFPVF